VNGTAHRPPVEHRHYGRPHGEQYARPGPADFHREAEVKREPDDHGDGRYASLPDGLEFLGRCYVTVRGCYGPTHPTKQAATDRQGLQRGRRRPSVIANRHGGRTRGRPTRGGERPPRARPLLARGRPLHGSPRKRRIKSDAGDSSRVLNPPSADAPAGWRRRGLRGQRPGRKGERVIA
jgi:hypothetical protein